MSSVACPTVRGANQSRQAPVGRMRTATRCECPCGPIEARSFGNQWHPVSPIVPARGEHTQAIAVPPADEAIAIVLDLIDPVRPGRHGVRVLGRYGAMKPGGRRIGPGECQRMSWLGRGQVARRFGPMIGRSAILVGNSLRAGFFLCQVIFPQPFRRRIDFGEVILSATRRLAVKSKPRGT